jgi:carbon storage regulator CsrA
MLVLSRKLKERIVLPTVHTAIQVLEIKRGTVRLGIDAPPEVTVLREEVPDRRKEWASSESRPADHPAVNGRNDPLTRQLLDRLKAHAVGLGLLRLQLNTGLAEEARTVLSALQQDFQLLLHGVEGELDRPPTKSVAKAHRRALLVEDDSSQREMLALCLRQSGLEVDTAGDGADALDYLRCHDRPDVVLLDMGLPRVDGPTIVREVRRNPAFVGLKIFGVSGHAPEEFDLEQGPAGVDRWFRKPFDPSLLVHDLSEELSNSVCGV